MNLPQHLVVLAIRGYRWTLSPAQLYLFGGQSGCRFTPTCSAYASEAVAAHGTVRGGWLAVKRMGRCHPWGGCGHDPVPPVGKLRFELADIRRQNPLARSPAAPGGSPSLLEQAH